MATEQKESAAFDVPLGELVRSLAMAVAEAQAELDRSSLIKAEMMSGQYVLRDSKTGSLVDADGKPSTEPVVMDSRVFFGHDAQDGRRVPVRLSMLELGFSPTFYQFVDTVIEVRIAVRVTRSEAGDGETRYRMSGTTVDATYAATYGYDLNAAALFRTKLVPIPPPPVLEKRIQLLLEREKVEARAAAQVPKAGGAGGPGPAGGGGAPVGGGGAPPTGAGAPVGGGAAGQGGAGPAGTGTTR